MSSQASDFPVQEKVSSPAIAGPPQSSDQPSPLPNLKSIKKTEEKYFKQQKKEKLLNIVKSSLKNKGKENLIQELLDDEKKMKGIKKYFDIAGLNQNHFEKDKIFEVKPAKRDEKVSSLGNFKAGGSVDEPSKFVSGKGSEGKGNRGWIGIKRSENGEVSEEQNLKGNEGGFSGYPQGVYQHSRFYNQQIYNPGDKDQAFLRPDGESTHNPKYRSMSTPQGFYYKQYQNYYPNPRFNPQSNPGSYIPPQSLPHANPISNPHPSTYSKFPPPPPDYQPGQYPSYTGTSPVPQYPGFNPRFQMKPYKKGPYAHPNYQVYNPYQNQHKRGMNKTEFQECLSQYFSKNEPSLDNFQNENKEEESSEVVSESLSSVNFEYGVGISPVLDQKKMKYQNNKKAAKRFSKSVDLKQEDLNLDLKQSVPDKIDFSAENLGVNHEIQSGLARKPEVVASEVVLTDTCAKNQKTKEIETQCDLFSSLKICSVCKSEFNLASSSKCHSNPSSKSNHSSQFSIEPISSDSELPESLSSLSLQNSENLSNTSLPYKRPACNLQQSPHKQHKLKDSAPSDVPQTPFKKVYFKIKKADDQSSQLTQNPNEDLKKENNLCASIENSPK